MDEAVCTWFCFIAGGADFEMVPLLAMLVLIPWLREPCWVSPLPHLPSSKHPLSSAG